MKVWGSSTIAIFSLVLLAPVRTRAETTAQAGFEKLATLAGQWKAQTPDGKVATANYRVVSNGSVLMEELTTPDGGSMITMYHVDGSNLILTHYCAAKNQPRMKADLGTSRPGELRFRFIDATNLADRNAGHMRDLTVKFQDENHMSQEWIFRKDGKDEPPHPFNYERVR